MEVVKENGDKLTTRKAEVIGPLGDANNIQPSNDFFNALFSDIQVSINGAEIGSTNACHPQIALLHNLLDYDAVFQQNVLGNSNIFYKDYQYPANNSTIRYNYIRGSKRVQLYGQLNHNVFTSKRLLLPNMSVKIEMKRTSPAFSLIRTPGVQDKYKIKVHNIVLEAQHVRYKESVLETLNEYSTCHVAHFPYTKTDMIRFEIPVGSYQCKSLEYCNGKMPKRAYFAVVEPESLNGNTYENNPMIFPAQHYGVNYVQFYSDHETKLLHKPYEPDFENENANRSYAQLVRVATDGFRTGHTPGLTNKDFLGPYGLFAIDNLPKFGSLTVKVGFNKPTPRLLHGIIFLQDEAFFTAHGTYVAVQNA